MYLDPTWSGSNVEIPVISTKEAANIQGAIQKWLMPEEIVRQPNAAIL